MFSKCHNRGPAIDSTPSATAQRGRDWGRTHVDPYSSDFEDGIDPFEVVEDVLGRVDEEASTYCVPCTCNHPSATTHIRKGEDIPSSLPYTSRKSPAANEKSGSPPDISLGKTSGIEMDARRSELDRTLDKVWMKG